MYDLTAELHAAVNDPQRWRAAWLALNEFMNRADSVDDVPRVRLAASDSGSSPCGLGTDRRCLAQSHKSLRKSDLKAAPPSAVIGDGLHPVSCNLKAMYLMALDALPLAAWLCNENRHLLHANTTGVAELKRQRWFKLEANQLCVSDRALQHRFVASFADLVAVQAGACFSGKLAIQIQGVMMEVGLRRVEQAEGSPFVLVSVAPGMNHDMNTAGGEKIAYWPERRLLSPRQRELAGLLLTFHSLDEAANKMGITRRTARDHLAGLFQSTGMRRQQDLINFLRQYSPF